MSEVTGSGIEATVPVGGERRVAWFNGGWGNGGFGVFIGPPVAPWGNWHDWNNWHNWGNGWHNGGWGNW